MTSEKDTSKKPSSSTGAESKKPSGPEKETGTAAKPAAAAGNKKRPVTIDLKPEKVEAKGGDAKADASAQKPVADAAKAATATPDRDGKASTVAPSTAAKSGETASSSSSAGDAAKEKSTEASGKKEPSKTEPTKPEPSPNFSGKPEPAKSGAGFGALLAAAIVGGGVSLGGAYLLLSNGVLPLQPKVTEEQAPASDSTEQMIADLQKQVDEMAQTLKDSDPSLLFSGLNTRLSELEKSASETLQQTAEDFGPAIEDVKASIESLKNQVAERGATVVDSAGNAIDTTILQPLEKHIESLSKTVDELRGKSEEATGETEELKTEVGTVNESVASVSANVEDLSQQLAELNTRLKNAEATAKAAQTAVSTSDVSLKTLADTQARASEVLSGLSADIDRLGKANEDAQAEVKAQLSVMSDRLAAVEATMGDATARELAARALSVSALKSAVDSGRSYETELAAVKAGLSSDTDLAALEAHAKSGITPVSVLIAEFPPVVRKMHGTFGKADPSEDVLESLWASARSIVSVRGPGDAAGSGPDAALRRMENAVSKGNLSAAISAYDELPDAAKAAGADWVERAKARVEVDELTDKASQDVLAGLARKDS